MTKNTAKYGLKTEYWTAILSILKSNPRVSEVILYGSRAKGNYKLGSDIDICLKGNDLSLSDLTALMVKLDELDLPWIIDLANFNQITNSDLIDHIDRIGIEL